MQIMQCRAFAGLYICHMQVFIYCIFCTYPQDRRVNRCRGSHGFKFKLGSGLLRLPMRDSEITRLKAIARRTVSLSRGRRRRLTCCVTVIITSDVTVLVTSDSDTVVAITVLRSRLGRDR
jgi:hypothetical protein